MKPTIRAIIILAAATAATTAQAAVYKCKINGQLAFQDRPCEEGKQEKIDIRHASGSDNAAPSAPDRSGMSDFIDYAEKKANIRKLQRDIKAAEKRVEKYHKDMDKELAQLRHQKLYANNNLAGAQWEESISVEMNAVVSRYNAMIGNERKKLEKLQEQLTALNLTTQP